MDPSVALPVIHPLMYALALVYSVGPWVIFAALAVRFFAPLWKGGKA